MTLLEGRRRRGSIEWVLCGSVSPEKGKRKKKRRHTTTRFGEKKREEVANGIEKKRGGGRGREIKVGRRETQGFPSRNGEEEEEEEEGSSRVLQFRFFFLNGRHDGFPHLRTK